MKIAIDISMALGQSAGVGTYTRGLIDGLSKVDSENDYVLYSYLEPPESSWLDFPQQPNISRRLVQMGGDHWERRWYEAELFPSDALRDVDVIHSPFFNAPKEHSGALVVTIYDVSFLLYPQFHTEANRMHCFNGTLKAVRYADRIIAISHHTKQDLMNYFAVSEDRIRVVHLAPRHFCYPERHEEIIRTTLERLGIYQDFLLFVGALEPRKNLKTLLEAYATYVKNHKGRELLVITGAKGWLNEEIGQLVSGLGLEEQIKFLGYVQESDLRVLYSTTKLFVYPSLYEGFGLPPLEAMACGAPVITSNSSSLPEVVGEAAILIDPHDSENLYQAMWRVMNDADLRMKMRQRSVEHARGFSWQRTALETLAVYQEVCPERFQGGQASRIGRKIQQSWEQFGKEDPSWAVLTYPDQNGSRWNEADFFEAGRQDIRGALERIARLGVTLKYEKALDLGCGPGRLSQALAEYFQEVHGVDIDPPMIAKANELNKYGNRCIYHLNEMPDLRLFEANTFDMVYSWLVLQHIPRQLALGYIVECARVTKPGGVMVFQVPNHRRSTTPYERKETEDLPVGFWQAQDPLMFMCATPSAEVVRMLEAADVRVIEADENIRADPAFVSCYYVTRKEPAALGDGSGDEVGLMPLESQGIYENHRLVTDIARCYFYHTIDLPEIGTIEGNWDLRARMSEYLGGFDFLGKRVLDVGAANGILSFSMEKAGAEVISFDLDQHGSWNLVPFANWTEHDHISRVHKTVIDQLNNAYWFCHRLYNSKAKVVYGNVYNIPEEIGLVDVAVYGSILLHLRDPFLALQSGLKLTREAVIVTEVLRGQIVPTIEPYMGFLPDAQTQEPKDTWWDLRPELIVRMIGVLGFEDTTITYHTQKYEGRESTMYTVVGRRTDGSQLA